jgi:hypothetical protein
MRIEIHRGINEKWSRFSVKGFRFGATPCLLVGLQIILIEKLMENSNEI